METMSETPDEAYRGLTQATMTAQFGNTTQLRKIKEEDFPFENAYTEFDAWVNSVSDVSVSTNKVIGNYIEILFEDINHRGNYRGTKYIYENETYLTYDKLNLVNVIPSTKAIKCNNFLSFKTKDGSIVKEPVFIGWEITSTNSQISKEGITENRRLVVLLQNNKYTNNIQVNQRFIFNHKRAFKVESIDDMQMDSMLTEDVTLNTLYIAWDVVLPTDDLVNNIANGSNEGLYNISIQQLDIEQETGYIGQLTSITTYNGNVISDDNVTWKTSNEDVVTIDQNGNYEIVGAENEVATITCISGIDINAISTINIRVVSSIITEKWIEITPNISSISKLRSVVFKPRLVINSTVQSDLVSCTPDWIDDKYYTIQAYGQNEYRITCIEKRNKPLVLKFETSDGTSKEISIKLEGLL